MFLLSCYAVLISKYSGKKDFIIGVPIANRNKEIYNDVIGMMINNLPIRITIKDDNTYKDILASVKKSLIEAYDNQNLPFEILADSLNLTRDTSHSLLIQTMGKYYLAQKKQNFQEAMKQLLLQKLLKRLKSGLPKRLIFTH